jgi:hypothetical protein
MNEDSPLTPVARDANKRPLKLDLTIRVAGATLPKQQTDSHAANT